MRSPARYYLSKRCFTSSDSQLNSLNYLPNRLLSDTVFLKRQYSPLDEFVPFFHSNGALPHNNRKEPKIGMRYSFVSKKIHTNRSFVSRRFTLSSTKWLSWLSTAIAINHLYGKIHEAKLRLVIHPRTSRTSMFMKYI